MYYLFNLCLIPNFFSIDLGGNFLDGLLNINGLSSLFGIRSFELDPEYPGGSRISSVLSSWNENVTRHGERRSIKECLKYCLHFKCFKKNVTPF